MAIGKEVEKRGHILGFKEEISAAVAAGKDDFLVWFNDAPDAESSFKRGEWDFSINIAAPLSTLVGKPENLTALEVGHGGGRLLASACGYFQNVVGVDIHEYNDLVENILSSRGITNFKLLRGNGETIPLDNSVVDVVYSYIVFQHCEKITIVRKYLAEAFRVLKPGGIGILYFGRLASFSLGSASRFRLLADRIVELYLLRKGYREKPARVNEINLQLTGSFVKKIARHAGFNVRGLIMSRRISSDGRAHYGGQYGILVKKPDK